MEVENMSRFLIVVAGAFVLVSVTSAQEEKRSHNDERTKDKPVKIWDGSWLSDRKFTGGVFGINDNEGIWVNQPNIPEESHNATPDEQRRLRVQWLEAYEPAASPERLLRVRGKFLLQAPDGKSIKPVDWMQGIQVVLTRSPGEYPDWDKPLDEKKLVWAHCLPSSDGSFEVCFPLENLNRLVGKTAPFQAAIGLGEKSGKTFTWSRRRPVLRQTVGILQVPGPRPLPPAQYLISAAPWPSSENYDALALIRAVNYLQRQGKRKAIQKLGTFLEIANLNFSRNIQPGNIDTSNILSVLLIVRLLFEPAEPNQTIQELTCQNTPRSETHRWPYFPVAKHRDIPFFLPKGTIDLNGSLFIQNMDIGWVEKHGKLRATPLRPPDDPLAAVDSFLAQARLARLFGGPIFARLHRRRWPRSWKQSPTARPWNRCSMM